MPVNIEKKPTDYADHLTAEAHPGEGTVTVQKTKSGKVVSETSESEAIPPQVIPPDRLYRVTVGGGRTINLGDYNGAKISAMVSVPCTKESLEDTYEFALEWVSQKIEQAMKD